jgi:uncharacterized protein YjiS (DUF1127 family)
MSPTPTRPAPSAPPASSVPWIDRLLCRIQAALRLQRERAELAALGAYPLSDVGLSHLDALPARPRCCA